MIDPPAGSEDIPFSNTLKNLENLFIVCSLKFKGDDARSSQKMYFVISVEMVEMAKTKCWHLTDKSQGGRGHYKGQKGLDGYQNVRMIFPLALANCSVSRTEIDGQPSKILLIKILKKYNQL